MKPTFEPADGTEAISPDVTDPLRPPAETRDWVAASVGADAEVVAIHRLPEGHWHASHVVTVRRPGGADQELVLRRWARPGWEANDPGLTPQREAAVLKLVGAASVPTPQLINLDADGTVCDVPAILTDRLPGDPPGQPQDIESFVWQLAKALVAIHAVGGGARERLPAYARYHENLDSIAPPDWSSEPARWTQAARIAAGPPPPGEESLIHRDYHPGNTLWLEGRLTGVVDWTQGSWGSVAVDTAHMRWNLATGYGLAVADRFLDHYQRLSSAIGQEQHYWDVITVLDLLPDLDPTDWAPEALARLDQYLEAVLP